VCQIRRGIAHGDHEIQLSRLQFIGEHLTRMRAECNFDERKATAVDM